jgi:hypothetical protein
MEDFSRTANFSTKTEEDRRLTGSVVFHGDGLQLGSWGPTKGGCRLLRGWSGEDAATLRFGFSLSTVTASWILPAATVKDISCLSSTGTLALMEVQNLFRARRRSWHPWCWLEPLYALADHWGPWRVDEGNTRTKSWSLEFGLRSAQKFSRWGEGIPERPLPKRGQ